MKAVKILGPGQAALVNDAEVPKLPSEKYLLIKTIAVALNPTDCKHIKHGDPATVGCDFSGIVVSIGSEVRRPFNKGDRVFGFVHGSNKFMPDSGTFSEYFVVKGDVVMHMPEGMTFEEAASMPVGIVTVGQGMYEEMGLPWPNAPLTEKRAILIWGGSSATGALAIQFAKLSGFEVITTCSPRNFEYVKALGADAVFDSRSPSAGADIRAYTKDKLYTAFDCIGEHGSVQACTSALASSAPPGQPLQLGLIVWLPGVKLPRDDIELTLSLGYSAFGEDCEVLGHKFPGQPAHFEYMVKWMDFMEEFLKERKIKPHRQDVRKGGFEGILSGLEDMKQGNVSGVKVVYRVADV